MDSWSAQQLKMMQAGGNDALNAFVSVRVTRPNAACPAEPRSALSTVRACSTQQYGVPKETDPRVKYNSRGAAVYRDKIKAVAEGRPWTAPPVRAPAARSSRGAPFFLAAQQGFPRALTAVVVGPSLSWPAPAR
jgi:ADP-ribosylation factor GTPase-activating protein 1